MIDIFFAIPLIAVVLYLNFSRRFAWVGEG